MSEKQINAFAPPLTGKEAEVAAEDLTKTYRKVLRSDHDLPVMNQEYSVMAIHTFKEPKIIKNRKMYGLIKNRGNYASLDQAKMQAASIVRNHDSVNENYILPVGKWAPLFDDVRSVLQGEDIYIDTSEEEQVMKAKQQKISEKMNERRRIEKEIKEREQEVKTAKDYNEDSESIDFYTMKRVNLMALSEGISNAKKSLEKMEKLLEENRTKIHELDSKHPSYDMDWVENYNKERKKAGINMYDLKFEDYACYVVGKKYTDDIHKMLMKLSGDRKFEVEKNETGITFVKLL